MTQIEKIKAEIERLKAEQVQYSDIYESVDDYARASMCEGMVSTLSHLLSFIESLKEEEQEDTDFVKQELERIREAEKKVKLPELIDFWWMQEDMEGNQVIAKDKEHFAQAMRKAYNVGLSQSESLEKEQESKIKGWVARDVNGRLGLYDQKPKYSMMRGAWEIGKSWVGRFSLDKINAFPKLTQFHEPIEVELTISRVSK